MNKVYYSFGNGVSGLGRWRLQTSSFLNFFLPVPPYTKQYRIASYIGDKISEIDSIIDEKKKQLSVLDAYKKSLIFEYVTGKKKVPGIVTIVSIDPHVLRLAIIADTLKEINVKRKRKRKGELKGKVVNQKLLYLCDVHPGLGLSTQYYRYEHGPVDLHLNSYIHTLVSSGWYELDTSGGAENLVRGEKHTEFLKLYGAHFEQHKSHIQALIQYFGKMKRRKIERFATLFAVWNDFIIDGIPTGPAEIRTGRLCCTSTSRTESRSIPSSS